MVGWSKAISGRISLSAILAVVSVSIASGGWGAGRVVASPDS
jgi:hypothetical protein